MPVVVAQVFVAEGESHYPLGEEFVDGELDPLRIAMIGEAPRELPQDAEVLLDLAEQQPPGVRGDASAIKGGGHFATAMPLEQ